MPIPTAQDVIQLGLAEGTPWNPPVRSKAMITSYVGNVASRPNGIAVRQVPTDWVTVIAFP